MSSGVTLKNLRKVFRDVHSNSEAVAVENLSLEIPPGKLVTLLGPSGCGKTTVLRMLAGFELPTSGEIVVEGKNITNLPANQRNSAMVFQSYALFPHMSVLQNITYGLKFRKISAVEKKKRLEKILDVVSLRGFEHRRPYELSGGQQQRVALARALIIEPALLLFDEPLSNLDAKLREFMRNEIRKIQQELNITAVYVTHDQSEAMAISDRVVVMNKARIEQVGTPEEVYSRPQTRFVADFMGAANFLNGKVGTSSAGRTEIVTEGISLEVPAQALAQGASVLVVARPEHVHFSDKNGRALEATIVAHHYLGAFHEYLVKLDNDTTLTARIEALPDQAPRKVGNRIHLSFRSENLTVLSV